MGIYSETGFHYGVERNFVYGADQIAEVKLFSILHFRISCRLVFKHLLFHFDTENSSQE
jgi:hypothetical protein